MVTDTVGLRYGTGDSIITALGSWAQEVQWLIDEPSEKLGNPILGEQRSYRKALLSEVNQ